MTATLTNPLRVGWPGARDLAQCLVIFVPAAIFTPPQLVPARCSSCSARGGCPASSSILGCASTPLARDDDFPRQDGRGAGLKRSVSPGDWGAIRWNLYYEPVDLQQERAASALADRLDGLDQLRANAGQPHLLISPFHTDF